MVWLQDPPLQLRDIFESGSFRGTEPPVVPTQTQWDLAHHQCQSQWFAAIAALEQLLLAEPDGQEGMCLSGPTAVLSAVNFVGNFCRAIVTPQAGQGLISLPSFGRDNAGEQKVREIPLFPQDPLAQEQFCLITTPVFSLLLLASKSDQGLPHFYFTFDPQDIEAAWWALRSRLGLVQSPQLPELDSYWAQYPPQPPDYKLVTQFSQSLIQQLPLQAPPSAEVAPAVDVELLRALTHEVRTPLTNIRTLTRLLLKRSDLSPPILQRLQSIDQECTEQIKRMELIFRAAELEIESPAKPQVPLACTSLERVFEENIPRWQRQAQRHQVELTVELPPTLPLIVSNLALLDQVLTGLIEKFVRSLASGGRIRLQVSSAGHQLKVQFHTQSNYQTNPLKALGDVLMFQPETGCLSLNLDVTRNLFQILGGKLTVRRRSPLEEVLTIYLPLGLSPLARVGEW